MGVGKHVYWGVCVCFRNKILHSINLYSYENNKEAEKN